MAFLVGGLLAYAAAGNGDIAFLVPFAAGSFIYIGASDLIPQVNRHQSVMGNVIQLAAFVGGLALLWMLRSIGR